MPEVVGFELTGKLPAGATATDLVLTVTQMLRKEGVVSKFVEFFGPGVSNMKLADRATIGNMAPEYGATMGFFPVDDETLDYLRRTGRTEAEVQLVERYTKEQGLFRTDDGPPPKFTKTLHARPGHGRAEPGRPEAAAGPRAAGGDEAIVSQGAASADRRARLRARRGRRSHARRKVVDNGHSSEDRPRRGRDRRDHQLHEHQQSRR